MIVDMRSDISNGLKRARLVDRETGEPIPEESRGWFYADDEAQVIRVHRKRPTPSGGKVRYFATPDGMEVRGIGTKTYPATEWTRARTVDLYEALYPDGSWRPYRGDVSIAWEEIRPARPFRIVVPERATQQTETIDAQA